MIANANALVVPSKDCIVVASYDQIVAIDFIFITCYNTVWREPITLSTTVVLCLNKIFEGNWFIACIIEPKARVTASKDMVIVANYCQIVTVDGRVMNWAHIGTLMKESHQGDLWIDNKWNLVCIHFFLVDSLGLSVQGKNSLH